MSLNPLAPDFHPNYQFPFNRPISLCNPTAMSLPLAQKFIGRPPPIKPSHILSLRQPITDDTFTLPFIQPQNPSKEDAEFLQPPHGSSSLLHSPLQHQVQCLQAFHTTIQQIHQHLKADQVDRKTLQLIILQLQNDFAILRSLLFSSVGTVPISDNSIKNPTTSPPIHPKPNPYPNPNPTLNALLHPCAAEPPFCRSTPVGAVGPPKVKTNGSANADIQPIPNTRETRRITAQNLTSRIFKL